MQLWRLSKPAYAPGLDGEGARLAGGRWNSPGRRLIYCSPSLSLAALEVLVHLPPPMRRKGALPAMVAVELELDAALIAPAPPFPRPLPGVAQTQAFGNSWIAQGQDLALFVPSAVIGHEQNVILNPAHPASASLRLVALHDFEFDDRLGS